MCVLVLVLVQCPSVNQTPLGFDREERELCLCVLMVNPLKRGEGEGHPLQLMLKLFGLGLLLMPVVLMLRMKFYDDRMNQVQGRRKRTQTFGQALIHLRRITSKKAEASRGRELTLHLFFCKEHIPNIKWKKRKTELCAIGFVVQKTRLFLYTHTHFSSVTC